MYFSIQIVGATINLGTFFAILEKWPELISLPVAPLAIGAILGLLFNFVATRLIVYGSSPAHAHPAPGNSPESSYSGRENLEVMKHARNYNLYLLDLLREHAPPGNVLDFGAGAGTFAKPLADAGMEISCVEPDADLRCELAKQGLGSVSSLEEVPIGSVDYIYTLNVLEHIANDGEAIQALASRLRSGGKLLIYVPAFQLLFSSMDRNVGHFRRYRRRSLCQLVESAGLNVLESRYVDSAGFFATLLFKALGNASGEISPGSVTLYDRFAFPVSRIADFALGRVLGKNLLLVAGRANS